MYTAPQRLELIGLRSLPLIREGDDLAGLVAAAAGAEGVRLADGDVLVVAQKIVSKAEGRAVRLADVVPGERARELAGRLGKDARLIELILREARAVLRVGREALIVEHRLGFVLANAGIDLSNANEDPADPHALLLPLDPDASAARLRAQLAALTGATLAVIVNDSLGRAWRLGTMGQALGVAGLAAYVDLRGRPDLFGRVLRSTEIGLADELAAAASLVMGQADERRPAVIVRGLPATAPHRGAQALIRPLDQDLFR